MDSFDHQTTLAPQHWLAFLAWSKQAHQQQLKPVKYLTAVIMAGVLIAGLMQDDVVIIMTVVVTSVVFALVWFAAKVTNNYFRNKIAHANPTVKLNSTGYLLGNSFLKWPLKWVVIRAVEIIEMKDFNVLQIEVHGKRTGYQAIKIPFNKQDQAVIQHYHSFISERI